MNNYLFTNVSVFTCLETSFETDTLHVFLSESSALCERIAIGKRADALPTKLRCQPADPEF